MAGENAQIKVEAVLDDKVSGGLKQMASNFKRGGDEMVKSGASIYNTVKGLAQGFIALAAVQQVVKFLQDISREGEEAARVFYKLSAINKVTSEAFGYTTAQLSDMAKAYQQVSTFGDESIMSAQSQLLIFSKIGKDIFPQVMQAAVDMGAAMGDVGQAANAIGRAMEAPIEGTRALRQAGIYLTDAQEAQIKKFMELGDILSAQKIILGEVTARYAGMAKEIAATPIGQLDQARERLADMREDLGVNMIPFMIEWNRTLADAVDWWNKIFFAKQRAESIKKQDELQAEANKLTLLKDRAIGVQESIDVLVKGQEKLQTMGIAFGPEATAALDKYKKELAGINAEIQKINDKGAPSGAGRKVTSAPAVKKIEEIKKEKSTGPELGPSEDDMNAYFDNLWEMQRYAIKMQNELYASKVDAREQELNDVQEWYAEQLILAEKFGIDSAVITELYAVKRYEINAKYAEAQAKIQEHNNKVLVEGTIDMFGALSELAAVGARKNKELAIASKALAIGKVIINTAIAESEAASSAPYPYNVPAIIAAAAVGATEIATIAAQQFAEGGIASGSRIAQDTVSARLTGGEMVLTEAQQARLFKMANGAGGGGGVQADFSITIQGNASNDTISRIADTREEQLKQFRALYKELEFRRQI